MDELCATKSGVEKRRAIQSHIKLLKSSGLREADLEPRLAKHAVASLKIGR